MNLFVDGHHLGNKRHGVEKFLSGLLLELENQNSSINILVGVEKSEFDFVADKFKATKIKVIPYRIGGILRLLFDIPHLIAANKIDIFYGQYFLPFLMSKRTRYFYTVHDILYEEYPQFYSFFYILSRRFLIKWGAGRAEKIFTISEYSKLQLHTRYQINSKKIIVIPIQIELPSQKSIIEDKLISNDILYVSRFEERKNHKNLIKLFSKLSHSESIRLVLVGFEVDGTKSKCIKLVQELDLVDKVDFFENIDSEELDNLHLNARVIIYPSLCEGLGMPVLEALLANSRVLFSNTTSMREFTFANQHMFNPLNQDDMYEKVLMLLRKPKMFEGEHHSTKSQIIEKYNVKSVAKNYSKNIGLI